MPKNTSELISCFLSCMLACSCLSLTSCSTIPAREWDIGFLSCADIDPTGAERVRALGPFVERQKDDAGMVFTAVRPFYSSTTEPARDRSLREFLWPVGMIKQYRGETYWRFLSAFGHDFDNADPESRKRFIVFPVLYTGRDKEGSKYFAVFPIGGTIHEFLGRDKINFALFPLYTHSSVDDVETYDVIWPLISWSKGEDVSRFRLFPLYGQSFNRNRWTKRFVLWPLWSSVRYQYPDQQGGGFVLFPLYGQAKAGENRSWTFLPPFFKLGYGKESMELNCPWPLFQYRSGDPAKLYIWPLWGRKTVGQVKSSFALWPIINTEEITRNESVLKRFNILPLVYHEKMLIKDDGNESAADRVGERYFKFWPLLSYERRKADARFRMLALWPLKRTPAVERNLAPIWSLYSHERTGEVVEDDVLWGLFRRRSNGAEGGRISLFPLFSSEKTTDGDGSREWNILMGLIGCKTKGLQKTYKILYFIKIRCGKEEK